jgi:hypothetical protein
MGARLHFSEGWELTLIFAPLSAYSLFHEIVWNSV